jgi:nucleotide-binding universal stress UspA family protein
LRREVPKYRKILAAFDGSEASESAFHQAMEVAAAFRAEVLLLSVAVPPEPAVEAELEARLEDAREHFEEAHARLKAAAATRGVELRTEIVVGHPAGQIVLAAERNGIDLVVMGTRGRSAFARWMLGSVSERVLRYAPCPVLVVR